MKLIENFFNRNDIEISDQETFFVYDLEQVQENVQSLKKLFRHMDQIYFSVKSNPSVILLRKLNDLGIGFDVSSERELNAAFSACADYSKITISGPAKTDAFISRFSKLNVKSVHLDSKEEYDLLKNTGTNLSLRWPLEGSYSQKVGLPEADLVAIVEEAAKRQPLVGVHTYIGRERANPDVVSKTLKTINEFVKNNLDSFIEKPNLFWGAGLPLVNHIEPGFFPEDSFFFTHLECGRALVHNAGFYITQILEVKQKASEKIVIINGGLQHLATHFGSPRFGQDDVSIYLPAYPNKAEADAPCNIYGSLGTVTDLLVKSIKMPSRVKRGDWIVIGPAGGYGYSAGTNQFLGPHAVREIFIDENEVQETKFHPLNYLEAGIYEAQNS